MEKLRRNGWMVAFLVVIALMCSHVIFGDAEWWDPPEPPAPTMTSLDAIYNAVTSSSPSIADREGFCKYVDCPQNQTTIILTVPAGRRFVLRKLWVTVPDREWRIDGGPNLSVRQHISQTNYADGSIAHYDWAMMWDFPDGCVVVEGPNDLTFTLTSGVSIATHFVGYFYDVP